VSTVNVNRVVDASGGVLAPISSVHRNRIINGSCTIDQRNAGASVTNSAGVDTYTLDRYAIYGTSASKFTCQQNAGSVTPPAGFKNYMGFTSLSANSPAATDEYIFFQKIEGFNTADLDFGTASAKTITLSAWVRSSLTGTFSGALQNSANNRFYPFSYSIPTANTWTNISVTIAGDTTGTWVGATNGTGLNVKFNLGTGSTYLGTAGAWTSTFANGVTGSVNVLGTNGATFYITGVQLEVGTQATSFEYRQYQQELALCQRYYQKLGNAAYVAVASGIISSGRTQTRSYTAFPSTMRASPTVTISNLITTDRLGFDSDLSNPAITSGTTSAYIIYDHTASGTAGQPTFVAVKNGTTGFLALSSEL
jgi:hypothetical protein